MKFSLTIHDLTAEGVKDVMDQLTPIRFPGDEVSVAQTAPVNTTSENQPAPTAATVPQVSAQISGVELDSNGLPWDERIHAGTKGQNKDGSWKGKRGVDDATIAAVTAELKARVANQPAAAPAPGVFDKVAATLTPPVAPGNVPAAGGFAAPAGVPTAGQNANVAPAVNAPSPMPAPVAAPVPQAAPARDFQGLMQKISRLFADKQITPDYPNSIVARINQGFQSNVATLTDIVNDPRMVEYAWQCLEVDGKAA